MVRRERMERYILSDLDLNTNIAMGMNNGEQGTRNKEEGRRRSERKGELEMSSEE